MTAMPLAAATERIADIASEYAACRRSFVYFVHHHVKIYDKRVKRWVPFRLWPAQVRAAQDITAHLLICCLKARQLGMTWLFLAHKLWRMLYGGECAVLLFSLRDTEAIHLLDDRLKGMYRRLPGWMKARRVVKNDRHVFSLSNGSEARAFSTRSGDSYAATDVLVDEADLVPNLGELLSRCGPTIDGGGYLGLLSRSDKTQPESLFKAIYRGAKRGENAYHPIFLPWSARPDRTSEWYARQCQDALTNFGSLDPVHEQYPATDAEALAPATLDKRIPAKWLLDVYSELAPLHLPGAPLLDGLRVYRAPDPSGSYVIGGDPAEGLKGGDDSALCVKDRATGESVAHLAGKYEPKREFPAAAAALSRYFNQAPALPERNNHGHAFIAGLEDEGVEVLCGPDGRPGWNQTAGNKADVYATYTEAVKVARRDGAHLLHDFRVYTQLSQIDRATLAHPGKRRGQTAVDDEATAEVLAQVACALSPPAIFGGWA